MSSRVDGLLLGVARAEAYAETERADRRAPRARALRRPALHAHEHAALVPPRAARARRAQRDRRRDAALAARGAAARRASSGRMPRYAWSDPYGAAARAPRRRSPTGCARAARAARSSSTRTTTSTATRPCAPASRSRPATRWRSCPAQGSFVALGAIVTDAELEPAEELVPPGCGSCTLCLDACPTGRADRARRARRDALPLDLDAVARPRARGARRCARGSRLRLRHLPGRLPLERRPGARAARELGPIPGAWVLAAPTGSSCPTTSCSQRHAHLYVPDRDPRYLRRNALIALGNGPAERARARAAATPTTPIRCCAPPRGARSTTLADRATPMPSRSARASTALPKTTSCAPTPEVGDDDPARGPRRARRRRASGRPGRRARASRRSAAPR